MNSLPHHEHTGNYIDLMGYPLDFVDKGLFPGTVTCCLIFM